MTDTKVTYGLLHYCYHCPDANNCWSEEICQACWEATGAVLERPVQQKEAIQANQVDLGGDETTKEQLRCYWID